MSDDDWRALGERIRDVLTPQRVLELLAAGRESNQLPRQPLKLWRARRSQDPAAFALRLLFLQDTVEKEPASRTLGALFDRCVEAGLVVAREGGGVGCPFKLSYANELLLLSDDLLSGGDAVMGAGETTGELARISYPDPARRVGSALDLGCGAGTIALLMAPLVARVVATDVNARAIVFGKINAAINRIPKIDWRAGNMFAPVAGETFDLVVSQPPFIPRQPGAADATFLFGGARGDELPLRALRELPPHLAPGGRAVMLIMWPHVEGEPLEERVRRAVGDSSLGVTLFASLPLDLDDWCTLYSMREHPTLGPEFDAKTIARREHLEREGIAGLSMVATVIERPAHGRGWTSTLPVAKMSKLAHSHIDAAIAARLLMTAPGDALLAAKLRAAPSAIFTEDVDNQVHVRFDDESPWPPLDVNASTYALIAALDEAPDVRTAIQSVYAKTRAPHEKIREAVELALSHGVVEVA